MSDSFKRSWFVLCNFGDVTFIVLSNHRLADGDFGEYNRVSDKQIGDAQRRRRARVANLKEVWNSQSQNGLII